MFNRNLGGGSVKKNGVYEEITHEEKIKQEAWGNMKKRILGKDLEVSAVGLGCMGFTHAYGAPCDEKEAAKVIRQAADMGYTFFDTAEAYTGMRKDGTTAWNEELVAKALKEQRNHVQIATKFGVHHNPEGMLVMDSRPEIIRCSVEESLKRLQTDYIDLYYQHRLDPKIPVEEVAGVMSELVQEGKILHWGISEANEENIRRAHAVCPLTCIQNRYSMMARWHEKLFPVLEELEIGYVAFSPLANGVLTNAYQKGEAFLKEDFRSSMPQYTEEGYRANQRLLSFIRERAEEKNASPAQISLAWMLCKKPYIVPIPGSRRLGRIAENAKADDILLTAEEVAFMDAQLEHMEMSGVFGGSPVKR